MEGGCVIVGFRCPSWKQKNPPLVGKISFEYGLIINFNYYYYFIYGQSWRRATRLRCHRDKLWVRFPFAEIKYLIFMHFFALVLTNSAALSSANLLICWWRSAMPPKFGGKWGAECFNSRLPLPTLLHAGYIVKAGFN